MTDNHAAKSYVATVLTLWLIIAYCMWGGNDHAKR